MCVHPIIFSGLDYSLFFTSFAFSFVCSFQRSFLSNCWIIKAICLYSTLHESLKERHYVNVNSFHFKTLRTGKNSLQLHGQSWPDTPSLQPHTGLLCLHCVCNAGLFSVALHTEIFSTSGPLCVTPSTWRTLFSLLYL